MKLSTKVRYGVRAMLDLALQPADRPVLVQAIAARQKLSKKYLDNLLGALRGAGLVRSVRGAKGGYLLARPPADISVHAIVVALDGEPVVVECATESGPCPRLAACVTRDLWHEAAEAMRDVLRTTTLADLARRAAERGEEAEMYHI